MRVKEFTDFIIERENVRINKEAGRPRPWTKDLILDRYRFCNVRREDDRVTKWLRKNWYPTFVESGDIWFAAVVARIFNLEDSLAAIRSYILPWKPEKVRGILHNRRDKGLKNFNAAYIVSTNGRAMDKVDYIIDYILNRLWEDRKKMRPKPGDTLFVYHDMLQSYDGLGSFMAAQIVADLKYMYPLKTAHDWWTFAASGPGSRRGLNRVVGVDVNAPWTEKSWRHQLGVLREKVNPVLVKAGIDPLHAQDIQNCLCEFDKYERVRLGEGTPKQIYKERSDA